MKKTIRYIFPLIITLIFLVGCSDLAEPLIDWLSNATALRYRENEIMEYDGARLDPIIGPRDNSIKGVQTVFLEDYKLKVFGLVDKEIDLDYSEVLDLEHYARKITLYCVEGWDATILWEGVLLEDIINLAGVSENANTVIFHAADGYTTSLPLDVIIDKELMLAHMANGLDLPPEMGFPFIVVAESRLGYKWARWVTMIEISDDTEYKGYWESYGYDNDAGL